MDTPARPASRLPLLLALAYLVWWAVLAVNPVSREIWWAENLPALGVFGLLAGTWRWQKFSNPAYGLMAVWLFWHTYGGHYTFAETPFDAVTEFFGFSRNHFDRVAHFSVGLYAYAAAEIAERRGWARPWFAVASAVLAIMAVAAGYEIVEWWFAELTGGDAGVEFLGSQGDIWDAQKDMLADTLGALFAAGLYLIVRRRRS